jgi:alkaline phosphatase
MRPTTFLATLLLMGPAWTALPGHASTAFPVRPIAGEAPRPIPDTTPGLGSAIFVHPDGTGVAQWGAARLITVGPDGDLAWDRLERIGVYRGHQTNSLASSSNAGATAHAYGVKVPYDSYGTNGPDPLTALSGEPYSVLQEAHRAGLATALLNSGHIAEPGTAVFATSARSRADIEAITLGLLEAGVDILMGGGEVLLLPAGEVGRFGQPGLRQDGRNLIRMAESLGYRVVYTRDELMRIPDSTERVLGVFAAGHTFNARAEDALRALDLPYYQPDAPTISEMTAKTLRMLAARDERFLLVVEEEGTDNFANVNNAAGTLEALRRADAALAAALAYVDRNPATLVLTAADSNAGGMEVWAVRDSAEFDLPLPSHTRNGAPLDGQTGTAGIPFVAEPDNAGRRLHFGIAWAAYDDVMGGVVARAHGLNAEWLPPSVDNTDIYRMLYATLFGKWLP